MSTYLSTLHFAFQSDGTLSHIDLGRTDADTGMRQPQSTLIVGVAEQTALATTLKTLLAEIERLAVVQAAQHESRAAHQRMVHHRRLHQSNAVGQGDKTNAAVSFRPRPR